SSTVTAASLPAPIHSSFPVGDEWTPPADDCGLWDGVARPIHHAVGRRREVMDRQGLVVTALVSAVLLALSAGLVLAGDDAPPPPYLQTKVDGIAVNVVFDAAAVRSVLPPGIEPVEELTGGIV